MTKDHNTIPISLLEKFNTSGAGYDLIRSIGLPDLFGDETQTMLYFMGKNLARKFDIQTVSDIIYAFEKLGWGKLEFLSESKDDLIFQLMADSVVYRLTAPIETEFRLEAGFLAASIEKVKNKTCECWDDIHKKVHLVEFSVIYTE